MPDDHRTAMPQFTAVDDQFGTTVRRERSAADRRGEAPRADPVDSQCGESSLFAAQRSCTGLPLALMIGMNKRITSMHAGDRS